jgi:FHA domain-containing protein
VNALARFEGFMQELMDRRVVRLLGGSLQPVELAHALAQAMEAGVIGGLAPSHFRLLLHPEDYADLRAVDRSLERKLAAYAVELARERGWNFASPPRVHLAADADVDRGRAQVEAASPGPDSLAAAAEDWSRRQPTTGSASAVDPGAAAAGGGSWARPGAHSAGSQARWSNSGAPPNDSPARGRRGTASRASEARGSADAAEAEGKRRWARPGAGSDARWSGSRTTGVRFEMAAPDGTVQLPLDHFPFSIGRRPGSDLVLPDPRVSRDHAVIEVSDGGWRLRDLGSRNGTILNGQPVAEADLRDGDHIAIGGFEVTARIERPA